MPTDLANRLDAVSEDRFVSWLRERELSEATIKSYRYGFHRFARWYLLSRGKVLDPSELTQSDIDDYREALWGLNLPPEKKRRLAGGSVWVFLSGARSFLAWAEQDPSDERS